MENEFDVPPPAFEAVDPSSKFVTVSNGTRRLDVPDGEGYLKTVDSGSSNGLPDGAYDLSKARDASSLGDRSYDGKVLHADKRHVYQLVGTEVLKHGAFELAKEKLPEIGAQLAVSYAAGVPTFTPSPVNTASATAAHAQKAPETGTAATARAEVQQDLDTLFRHHPNAGTANGQAAEAAKSPSLDGQIKDTAKGPSLEEHLKSMGEKVDGNPDYAKELHQAHPDLFQKVASPQAKESIKTIVDGAEKADQLKTISEKAGGKSEDKENARTDGKGSAGNDKDKTKERQGFVVPSPIKTSAEARAHAAREMLSRAHNIVPMIAAKQIMERGAKNKAARQNGHENAPKAKRGMSR